jgi:hypothetical protein
MKLAMHVSIDFPAEIETVLRRRAAAAGQDVATFVKEVVAQRLAHEEESHSPVEPSQEEFTAWLARWINLHPTLHHPVDDSRESIYAGCGE